MEKWADQVELYSRLPSQKSFRISLSEHEMEVEIECSDQDKGLIKALLLCHEPYFMDDNILVFPNLMRAFVTKVVDT